MRHATYDWTEGPADANLGLREVWVDAKSPGDGWTYQVGTAEVVRTRETPGNPQPVTYSGVAIEPAIGLLGFEIGTKKQVVVLQAIRPNQSIAWQRFYYGFVENSERWTNARAISVWAGPTREATRIAICGETTNDRMPLDQLLGGVAGTVNSKGFIAVFDGRGDLLWSYTLLCQHATNLALTGDVVVTDVAMRVEGGEDVVTYCGFSNGGTEGLSAASIAPLRPFAAPTIGCSHALAGGAAHNGSGSPPTGTPGACDGFVGRLRRPQVTASPAAVDFHSVVGGSGDDVLNGIAEIDANRFVVVGSSRRNEGPVGALGFPFTASGINPSAAACVASDQSTPAHRAGVVMLFRVPSPAVPPDNLVLEWSRFLGSGPTGLASQNGGRDTVARDVVVQRNYVAGGFPAAQIVIVGRTTEEPAALFVTSQGLPAAAGAGVALAGPADGFVITYRDWDGIPSANEMTFGAYWGGEGDDSLSGVQSWNEHVDHFTVCGVQSRNSASGSGDVVMTTFWMENASTRLVATREVQLAAAQPTAKYLTAALGTVNRGFETQAGGGVAVDERGRVTVVGAHDVVSLGARYPASTLANAPTLTPGRPSTNAGEAYRVVLDMLPANVGRTDGTGAPTPAGMASYPLPGIYGGTTPECALSPFGNRGDGVPALARMLIDYVGPDPANNQPMRVVVDRPPYLAGSVSAWQVGFPGDASGAPVIWPEGLILWTPNWQLLTTMVTAGGGGSVDFQWVLPSVGAPTPPATVSVTLTVQLVSLLAAPIPGGSTGPVCPSGGSSGWAASPAMWFQY